MKIRKRLTESVLKIGMKRIISSGELTRKVARRVRRFALGKSQLDSVRTKLSVARITEGSNDTALRTVKTAYDKYLENLAASKDEHMGFKANLRDELESTGDKS